jgi:hypothetical protein
LPRAFDPASLPEEKAYACVRVSGDGQVLGVRFIGIRDPYSANALTTFIRGEWRFRPVVAGPAEGGWVRVRLNEGAPEPPSIPMPRLD